MGATVLSGMAAQRVSTCGSGDRVYGDRSTAKILKRKDSTPANRPHCVRSGLLDPNDRMLVPNEFLERISKIGAKSLRDSRFFSKVVTLTQW